MERKLASPPGEAEQYDLCLRRRDGTDLWVIVSSSAVTDDDGRPVGTLAMVTDITERRQAEARIRRIARLYAVSSSMNEAIVRLRSTQELYEQACRIAVEQGRLRLAWVGLCDEAGKTLRPVARFGADDGYVDRVTLSLDDPLMNRGPAGAALRTGARAVENDIATASDFYWKGEALAHGLRSCAAFPLTLGDRRVGVLLLYADGRSEVRTVGSDLSADQRPQLFIPGGTFHTARVKPGGEYALLGTSVFIRAEPADVEMGDANALAVEFPAEREHLAAFNR